MNNPRPMVYQKPKKQYSIPIIVLSVILALNFLSFLVQMNDSRSGSYGYEYSDMIRLAKRGDYPTLADDLLHNEIRGYTPKKDTSEFLSLVEYYRAAQLYRAFLETAKNVDANEQLEIMKLLEPGFTDPDILDAVENIRNQFLMK